MVTPSVRRGDKKWTDFLDSIHTTSLVVSFFFGPTVLTSYVDTHEGAYNTTLGDYRFSILTLASIVDTMSESVCPSLLASDTFCDVLMGKMTPLMFPYLFPKLDHAIFVDRYKSNYQMASAGSSNGNNFAGPCYSKTTSASCGTC